MRCPADTSADDPQLSLPTAHACQAGAPGSPGRDAAAGTAAGAGRAPEQKSRAPGPRAAPRPGARARAAEGPRGPRPRATPPRDFEGAHFPETGLPAPAGVPCTAPRNKRAMVSRLPGLLLSAGPLSRLAGRRRGGRGRGRGLRRALRKRLHKRFNKVPVVPGPRGLTLQVPPKQKGAAVSAASWTRRRQVGGRRSENVAAKAPGGQIKTVQTKPARNVSETPRSAYSMSCYVVDFWKIFLSVILTLRKFKRFSRER